MTYTRRWPHETDDEVEVIRLRELNHYNTSGIAASCYAYVADQMNLRVLWNALQLCQGVLQRWASDADSAGKASTRLDQLQDAVERVREMAITYDYRKHEFLCGDASDLLESVVTYYYGSTLWSRMSEIPLRWGPDRPPLNSFAVYWVLRDYRDAPPAVRDLVLACDLLVTKGNPALALKLACERACALGINWAR